MEYQLLIYRWDADDNVRGRGRNPNFLSQNLPRIEDPGAAYPHFSFRQLPWDCVGYHPLIYCRRADNNVYGGGGAGGQCSRADIYLKFKSLAQRIPILAAVSLRGLPWTM